MAAFFLVVFFPTTFFFAAFFFVADLFAAVFREAFFRAAFFGEAFFRETFFREAFFREAFFDDAFRTALRAAFRLGVFLADFFTAFAATSVSPHHQTIDIHRGPPVACRPIRKRRELHLFNRSKVDIQEKYAGASSLDP